MLAIRYIVIAVVIALLGIVIGQHEHGAIKGMPVPIANVLFCMFAAAVAAAICRFRFNRLAGWIATPFVAGIAGAFGILGESYGPYGGVVGLLVGIIVLALPTGSMVVRAGSQVGSSPRA